MRSRPRSLLTLGALFALIGVGIPALSPDSPMEPITLLLIAAAMFHADATLSASRLLYLSMPLLTFGLVFLTEPTLATLLGQILLIVQLPVLMKRSVRQSILNPKQRWWLTPRRQVMHSCTVVRPTLGGELRSKLFDISETGAFITMDDAAWAPNQAAPLSHLAVGNRCFVVIHLNQLQVVQCYAEIVRQSSPTGNYPGGFAVKFLNLDRQQHRVLSNCLVAA